MSASRLPLFSDAVTGRLIAPLVLLLLLLLLVVLLHAAVTGRIIAPTRSILSARLTIDDRIKTVLNSPRWIRIFSVF